MKYEHGINCPHCNNLSTHNILCTESVSEDLYDETGEFVHRGEFYYMLTHCKSCNDVVLFVNSDLNDFPQSIHGANVLYPSQKKLDGIPDAIRKTYEEAKKVKKRSSMAFVVLIRKVLELICEDKQADGRTLHDKISFLATKEIIPEKIYEMARAIKYFGNMGAHDYIEIDYSDVEIIDDLIVVFIEYVYIAPMKLSRLRESFHQKYHKSR